MERVEADKLSKRTSTKVWNVQEFCRRQNLCQKEEWRLTRLFGRSPQLASSCTTPSALLGGNIEGSLPCKPGRLILRAEPIRLRPSDGEAEALAFRAARVLAIVETRPAWW